MICDDRFGTHFRLWVANGWEEWYYDMLVPLVHFVPVRADLSDLCAQVAWVRAHPARAAAISAAAQRFVREQMRPVDRDIYVGEILLEYGRLWARSMAKSASASDPQHGNGNGNGNGRGGDPITKYVQHWHDPVDYKPTREPRD